MRKKLLILCEYFPPAEKAGGPLRTIEAVASILSEGYNVYVIAKGYDFLSADPLPRINLNSWNKRDQYQVYYTDKFSLNFSKYAKLVLEVEPDLIFLNSFFSPRFSFIPLIVSLLRKSQFLCCPRGELSKPALKIKPIRKMIYLFLTSFIWKKNVSFVASSEKEKVEIVQSLKLNPAQCFVGAEPTLEKLYPFSVPEKETNKLSVLFLARLNPIKNLDFAISCVSECEDIQMDIFGPINSQLEQNYWAECVKLIKKNNLLRRVRYHGLIPNEKVSELISKHHLLFAPSASENFGHSILESLSIGRPVLIGDQTPWSEVQNMGAGYAMPLSDKKPFIDALKFFQACSKDEFGEICERAKAASRLLYSNSDAIASWHEIIKQKLAQEGSI